MKRHFSGKISNELYGVVAVGPPKCALADKAVVEHEGARLGVLR